MTGVPVTDAIEPAGSLVSVRIGDWTSGLYFARLDGSDGGVGFAPFVVTLNGPYKNWKGNEFRPVDQPPKPQIAFGDGGIFENLALLSGPRFWWKPISLSAPGEES